MTTGDGRPTAAASRQPDTTKEENTLTQPDPDLVRRQAARVIDNAIEELRDTGIVEISEICEDALEDTEDRDEQDALLAAIRDSVRAAEITYTLPAWAETPGVPAADFRLTDPLPGTRLADMGIPGPAGATHTAAEDTAERPEASRG